jgi:hypothetical protein
VDNTTAFHGPPPHLSAGFQRSGPVDSGDRPSQSIMAKNPSPASYHHSPHGYSYPSPPHYPYSRHHLPIQSVITTSFSMEEEREDGISRHRASLDEYRSSEEHHSDSREAPNHVRSQPPQGREPPHYGRELPPIHENDRDLYAPPPMARPGRVPISPRNAVNDRPYLQRTHSAGGPSPAPPSYRGQGPLKRNFWHHARPGEEYPPSPLPHDFMPPKRTKIDSPSKDYVVAPRHPEEQMYPPERHRPSGYFNRSMSWGEGSREQAEYYQRGPSSKSYPAPWERHHHPSTPSYRGGEMGSHWSDAPQLPMSPPRSHYSPSEANVPYERSGAPWSHPRAWHPHMSPDDQHWGGAQRRDEAESKHSWPDMRDDGEVRRQATFESTSDQSDPYHHHPTPLRMIGPPQPLHGLESKTRGYGPPSFAMDNRMVTDGSLGAEAEPPKMDGPVRLLALPDDRISLSETLCVVREVRLCFVR